MGTALFIILWVLSPIILLPMCISYSSKRKKIERFINQLYREGRISSKEKFELKTEREINSRTLYNMTPVQRNEGSFFKDELRNTYGQKGVQNDAGAVGYVPQPQQTTAEQNTAAAETVSVVKENTAVQTAVPVAEQAERQPQHHHSGVDLVKHEDAEKKADAENIEKPVQEAPVQERPAEERTAQEIPAAAVHTIPEQRAVPMSAEDYNNRQPLPEWARPQVVQRPKREKKQYSSAAVLTGIGITFVALAGIIFSRAFWVQMSDWTRVGVLAGQAILFFAMFGFAHKKLKIEGTAAAVYILGSVFATISYITMGYFGLLGAWFGFEGGGMMLFLAMGALLVTFFSAGAMKVFSKPFCEYAACVSMAFSGTMVLAQFADYFENKYAAFSLMISAAGLIASVVYHNKKSAGKEISKPVDITYKLVKATYATMAAPCLIADLSNSAGFGWSLLGWGVWLIYTGEALWRAILGKSEKWLALHGGLILFGALSLFMTMQDVYSVFALMITVFSALGSWAYMYLDKKDRLLFRADKVHFAMRAFFMLGALSALFMHPYDSYIHLALVLIWAVDYAVMASVYKHQALLIPQCAAVISLAYEMVVQIDTYRIDNGGKIASLILLCAGMAATLVYRLLERKGKVLVKANFINVVMRALLSLPAFVFLFVYSCWDGYSWAMCLLFMTELSAYAILYRRQREIFFRFAFIAMMVYALIPSENLGYGLDRDKLYVLVMFGISVVCTAVYKILVHYDKALFRAKQFVYFMKAVIGFGCLLTVYSDFISYGEFSWVSWVLMGGMAVETLVYAIIKKSAGLLFIHNILNIFMLLECWFYIENDNVFILFVTAMLAVLTMAYFTLDKKNKLRFTAMSSIVLMRSMFGAIAVYCMVADFGVWSPECFGLGIVVAIEMLYYGIIKRSQTILAFEMIALTYSFWQIGRYADNFSVFALICCLVVAAGTLADEFLKKKRFEAGLLIAGTRMVYMMFYILMLIVESHDFSWMSVAVWTILPAEMIFHGIRSKNSLFIKLQSLELPVLFYVLSCIIGDKLGGGYTITFIFTMFIAAALAVYYIIPAVFTPMADMLYTAILFIASLILLYGAALPYGVFAMAVAVVFMAIQAFSDSHVQSRFMRFFLPVPEMVTALMLSGYLSREYGLHYSTLCMGICAGVLCVGAFALRYADPYNSKFELMKFSMEICSGISLLLSYSGRRDATAAVIVTVVSVMLFAAIHTSRSNYHGAIPMLTLFMGIRMWARAIEYDPMCEGDIVVLFSIFMTAVLVVASKLMYPDGIQRKVHERSQIDIAHFGILLCVLCCLHESMMFSPRGRMFIGLLELTVFTANFMRRETTEKARRAILTAAAALAGLALVERPFMQFENSTVTTKVILLIIVAFGMAVKKIWADDENVASEFSQTVFMAAFLLLIVDGLMNQSLSNSLIVLSVSLVLLIFSFVKKTRRWFLVSASALLGLTLYITGDFLSAVAWWAYLLLAGVLLIAVAAVTEYMRQRAARNPNEERFFVDWKW